MIAMVVVVMVVVVMVVVVIVMIVVVVAVGKDVIFGNIFQGHNIYYSVTQTKKIINKT